MLAHGADASVVDLESCAAESAQLLRDSLQEIEEAPAAAQTALSGEEKTHFASECFCHLVPALLTCLGNTQSPKLHKRVLMVLSLLVQRAGEVRAFPLSAPRSPPFPRTPSRTRTPSVLTHRAMLQLAQSV